MPAQTYLDQEREKEKAAAAAKEVRLTGCQAFPAHGQPAGPTMEWCRSARGAWCPHKCKWRNA
ncbi:MAG: hypothetical protein ACOY32_15240 [Thermodesulfobacteriota bacterium]